MHHLLSLWRGCQCLMKYYFQLCWDDLGYAQTSSRSIYLLERVICQSSKCTSVEDGSVMPLQCLWWERNDRSFEDHDMMVVELKSFFFFNPLTFGQLRQIIIVSLVFMIFLIFFFSLFSQGFLLYLSWVLELHFLRLLMIFQYL